MEGHNWLEECWQPLDDELDDELGALLLTLSFFSSRKLAEMFLAECTVPGKRLDELAETCRRLMPDAMREYAQLGRCIERAIRTVQSEARKPFTQQVGRNDPCPCGSGKKHKKCCLARPVDGSV